MMSRIRTLLASMLRWVLRWAVAVVTSVLALVLGIGGYFWFSTDLPDAARLRAQAALGATRLLDRRGQVLYVVPDPFSSRRQPLALREMPLVLRQATIAVEDSSFYHNAGVDLRGMVRALWLDVQSGAVVAGGSTITQQLARGFLLDPAFARQRSLERKLRETTLALKLTATYTKEEILALYLNQIYYGGLTYGAEAAAWHFFGKPARDLDLAECALLAGLPQSPSRYDPFADPQAAKVRQSQVLAAMVRTGVLTAAQAQAARDEPLLFVSDHESMRAPHFVQYVLDELTEQLGADVVARGGLVVTTTLDADLQDVAQEILRRQIAMLSTSRRGGPDHRVHNGAVIVLEPASGAILTMVGSPDFDDGAIQGQVNASLARRQPGSAIKPLTYAAALERGWTPATEILDVPTSFATREGRPYTPENYDRAYHGPLLLREALATSSNVAAVRVLDAIGVPALLDLASRLGVSSLGDAGSAGRYGLSLTLGGGEVTPLELTSAYAAFAHGGRRVRPFAILAMSGPGGALDDVLVGGPFDGDDVPVVRPQVAYLMSDILADRYARMRAFGANSVLDVDRPAAVKTGTTSNWRDNWTIGYTPDRVVGVWVGNADGQAMEAISGVSGAGPVWHDVMLAAHRDLPPRAFVRPAGIVEVAVCAEGGKLPSADCPMSRLERFIVGTQPTEPDASHRRVAIDSLLGCRAPAGYPVQRTVVRTFRVFPPEAEAWAAAMEMPRVPQQVCAMPVGDVRQVSHADVRFRARGGETAQPQDAEGMQSAEAREVGIPVLLVPAPGAVFALSAGVPRERQQMMLVARAGATMVQMTMFVDGQPLATFARPPYRAFWSLTPGSHRAMVEARDGQGRVWHSAVVEFLVKSEE